MKPDDDEHRACYVSIDTKSVCPRATVGSVLYMVQVTNGKENVLGT